MEITNNRTRYIVYLALFIAIAVVLKLFLRIPITFAGAYLKDINLSPVMIMMSGIMFGPFAGAIVGALTDVIVTLTSPMGAYIPLFTITNALIGFLPALFFRNKEKKITLFKCFWVVLIVQVVCSMVLNTTWMVLIGYIPFDMAIISVRLISALIMWPIYSLLLFALLKATRRIFKKQPITPHGQ